jgi:hypothetical protein
MIERNTEDISPHSIAINTILVNCQHSFPEAKDQR